MVEPINKEDFEEFCKINYIRDGEHREIAAKAFEYADAKALEFCTKVIHEFEIALEESLKLQSHYAFLLNSYDGGERKDFKSVAEWIDRLKTYGTIKSYYVDDKI